MVRKDFQTPYVTLTFSIYPSPNAHLHLTECALHRPRISRLAPLSIWVPRWFPAPQTGGVENGSRCRLWPQTHYSWPSLVIATHAQGWKEGSLWRCFPCSWRWLRCFLHPWSMLIFSARNWKVLNLKCGDQATRMVVSMTWYSSHRHAILNRCLLGSSLQNALWLRQVGSRWTSCCGTWLIEWLETFFVA